MRFGKGKSVFGDKTSEVLQRKNDEFQHLDLKDLIPSRHQPRKAFKKWAMNDLINSIRTNGVKDPLVVAPITTMEGEVKYEIISGERRYRAAKNLELSVLPCLIRTYYDDEERAIDAALLNDNREKLNDIEWANHIDSLFSMDLNSSVIAKRLNKKPSTVRNLHRLTKLTEETQALVIEGKLSTGHVKPLIGLGEEWENKLTARAINEKLSVRQIEALAKDICENNYEEQSEKENFSELNEELREKLASLDVGVQSITCDNQGRPIVKLNSYDFLKKLVSMLSQSS